MSSWNAETLEYFITHPNRKLDSINPKHLVFECRLQSQGLQPCDHNSRPCWCIFNSMHESSIYWFNKIRGITLLLLPMNCQQCNLVKSYRGCVCRTKRDRKGAIVMHTEPLTAHDSGKSKNCSFPTALNFRHFVFLRMLPTNWFNW